MKTFDQQEYVQTWLAVLSELSQLMSLPYQQQHKVCMYVHMPMCGTNTL